MDEIDKIASKHLGKKSNGGVNKKYQSQFEIDENLLVCIPRALNREHDNIKSENLPFLGWDVWHAFEFSFLLSNSYPVTGLLKIIYPCESLNIIESKSLKLFLNSFNFVKFEGDYQSATKKATNKVIEILSKLLKTEVNASFHDKNTLETKNIFTDFTPLEDSIDFEREDFDIFKQNPSLLQTEQITKPADFQVSSRALRSNCRVTNQPDWGDIFIKIIGDQVPTKISLLKYIISMRQENHFHEEICEHVFKTLCDLLPHSKILVACLYTRRGGIDINPIRISDESLLNEAALLNSLLDLKTPFSKTFRQ